MNQNDEIITGLEDTTKRVAQCLIEGESSKVSALVVEQCRWATKIQQADLSTEQVERLRAINKSVVLQQQLIAQALSVTNDVLQDLLPRRSYSTLA